MIQHGILIEQSFSVKIQLKTPSGTSGGIKTHYKLDGPKIIHLSIVNKEKELYVLGKRENQKQMDDGGKKALQKQNNILEKNSKSFIGLHCNFYY